MKKLLVILLAFSMTSMVSYAQDATKEAKNAAKTISKGSSDPIANSGDLNEAYEQLKTLLNDEAVQGDVKTLTTAAEALNELANEEFKAKTLDATGTYQLVVPGSALLAFKALKYAAKLDPGKKDIAYGLEDAENLLNNYAIFAYQEQDYGSAFKNFAASIKAHDLLKSMGKDSRLDDPSLLKDQYFFASVSSFYNKQYDEAKPYLMKLYEDGNADPFVYDALYNITLDSDEVAALQYLSTGREMHPDDTGLLFTEINHYLKAGELDILIGKLKTAIEKEPDNVSVYNTLGSVYDQLHQKAFQEGDSIKAEEYFDNAYDYYNQVMEKQPENFDATYSIGALYYNKAASYVDRLNELASDFSPAGMKAYDETKAEMDALFEEALPYFQKADSINSEDRNTLIALKEIYARLNNLEKSEEYKKRLEAIGVINQ